MSSPVNTCRIVTSSWFTKLDPSAYCRIGISRGTPRGQDLNSYTRFYRLNPGEWFQSVTPQEYGARYASEILAPLDPQKVVDSIMSMAGDRIPALLCFEGPEPRHSWCHRGLVSAWLKDTLDLDVFELGQEMYGCGWEHPKLHASLRRGRSIEEIERALGFRTPEKPARTAKPTRAATAGIGTKKPRRNGPAGQGRLL